MPPTRSPTNRIRAGAAAGGAGVRAWASAILWRWWEAVTGASPRRARAGASARRERRCAARAARRSGSPARSDEQRAREPPRVVVPRWVQLVLLPLALLALWALAKAAGKVLLIFVVAGAHRADPQPGRRLLHRDALPARPRGPRRVSRILPRRSRASGSCSPTLSPIRCSAFTQQPAAHSTREANKQLVSLQKHAQQTRRPRESRQTRAKRRCRASTTNSPRAPANSPRSAARLRPKSQARSSTSC